MRAGTGIIYEDACAALSGCALDLIRRRHCKGRLHTDDGPLGRSARTDPFTTATHSQRTERPTMGIDYGGRLQNYAYHVIKDDVGREFERHLGEWKTHTND